MKIDKTARGFAIIKFIDRYGVKCSLQKSSLASEDAIWFGVDDPEPKMLATDAHKLGIETEETCGWIPYGLPEELQLATRMHLTQAQLRMLLPHLLIFAEAGDLQLPNDWREYSLHIAKGEKCPDTIETLQAAWARDQEVIEDQRCEIARLKLKLNQERQRRDHGTVTGRAVGLRQVDMLLSYPRQPGKATHLQILKGRTGNGEFKLDLDFKPDFAEPGKAFADTGESAACKAEVDGPQYEQAVDVVGPPAGGVIACGLCGYVGPEGPFDQDCIATCPKCGEFSALLKEPTQGDQKC